MKTLLYTLPIVLLLACNTPQMAQQTPATPPAVVEQAPAPAQQPATPPAFVTWDKKKVELGEVKKGETRSMNFSFTNTSGEPVQIEIIDACDCTTVDYPRGVIEPGKSATLNVDFDSKDKDASETIDVRVIFKNTDSRGYPRIEVIQYSFELIGS